MKKLFTLSFVLFVGMCAKAQVPSYVPSNLLLGYWNLNNNAADSSGNGNDGSATNVTSIPDRNGIANAAYGFNGTSSSISVPSQSTTTGIKPFTIAGWVKLNRLPTVNAELFSREISANSLFRVLVDGTGKAGFVMSNQGGYSGVTAPSSTFADLKWHHLVAMFGGGWQTLYVDGGFAASAATQGTLTGYNAAGPLVFGTSQGGYYDGNLDEIGIWAKTLDSCAIAKMYLGRGVIVTQPSNASGIVNGSVNISVTAADTTCSYQWQLNSGTGFQNLADAGQYSGANKSTLAISNLTLSNSGNLYRCIVSFGTCQNTTADSRLSVIIAGIEDVVKDKGFAVYPVPASSQVTVSVQSRLVGSQYAIYDVIGTRVLSGSLEAPVSVLDVSALSSGAYRMQVADHNQPLVITK